jgi:hypothetical protein
MAPLSLQYTNPLNMCEYKHDSSGHQLWGGVTVPSQYAAGFVSPMFSAGIIASLTAELITG